MNPLKFLFASKKDPTNETAEVDVHVKRIMALVHTPFRESEMVKLLKRYPMNIGALTQMGFIYSQSGNHEKQISCQQKILAISKDQTVRSIAHYGVGVSYYKMGKFQEAIKAFENSINLQHSNFLSYRGLGDVYNALKKYEKAKENYLQFYDWEEAKDSRVSINLASIEMKQGNYEMALKYMKDAIAIDPTDSDWQYSLALLFIHFNKESELLIHLRHACQEFPNDYRLLSEYSRRLVIAHEDLDSFDSIKTEAIELARRAFKINPRDIETRLVYANAMTHCVPENKKMVFHAIDILKKTLLLTKDDFYKKKIYVFLAISYLLVSEYELSSYYNDLFEKLK